MMQIQHMLEAIRDKNMSVDEGMKILENLPFIDIGDAKIDLHRSIRKGFPEAILATGKTSEQIKKIVEGMAGKETILITKASQDIFEYIKDVDNIDHITYFNKCKMIFIGEKKPSQARGYILTVTAGTGDIPIAEEAAVTAEIMGNKVERLYDVGIAGIHRLLAHKDLLSGARVIIASAGMEGVLPGIIAGLVAAPVIALPTSIGYGTGIKGLSAILTMLNSCSPGIAVMNIDNGYGAGIFAHQINTLGDK